MDSKFSICIPNYNYEQYIVRTIESVREQTCQEFEVHVSDNASTDGSVAAVEGLVDPRIRVTVNQMNVGFAGNLDRAARHATGEFLIMLSSDDLMRPRALDRILALFDGRGSARATDVVVTATDVVGPDDNITGRISRDAKLWVDAAENHELSERIGSPVYSVSSAKLLARSLRLMRNPLPFLSTCYPRALFEAVEGYGGGRLINPDKWFAWKLMQAAETVHFIDEPLFAYRVHPANQGSQQAKMGVLKHLVDQYVSSFEVSEEMLAKTGLTRDEVAQAFVEQDVALRGLSALADGNRTLAWRSLRFGEAAYPDHTRWNPKVLALRLLLLLGPAGVWAASVAKGPAMERWDRQPY